MNGGVWEEGGGPGAEMEGGGKEVSGASHCDMEPLKGLWRDGNIKSRITPQSLFSSPSSTPPSPLS